MEKKIKQILIQDIIVELYGRVEHSGSGDYFFHIKNSFFKYFFYFVLRWGPLCIIKCGFNLWCSSVNIVMVFTTGHCIFTLAALFLAVWHNENVVVTMHKVSQERKKKKSIFHVVISHCTFILYTYKFFFSLCCFYFLVQQKLLEFFMKMCAFSYNYDIQDSLNDKKIEGNVY